MRKQIQTQNITTAHSLYMLYETLPNETQQIFLKELLAKQSLKQEKIENPLLTDDNAPFQDLFGILTASKGASLEDMDKAILERAKEEFNDCD